MVDYTIEHWTTGQTDLNGENSLAISISINNRAATRQAIINHVRQSGMNFIERSNWAAHKNRSQRMRDDWDYTKIAIHHAGRSFNCGPAALQLQDIQDMQMNRGVDAMDDIGYHYALDCFGNVFEGRGIRFKGENVSHYNTGVIGIVLLENLSSSDEGYDSVTAIRKFLHRMGFDPTPSVPEIQRQSIAKFINILCDFFHINTLGGHREFPGQSGEGKICPGNVGLTLVGELRKTTGLSAP
ncbi:N-acetylmuramoyl-L-alanine amidase [Paraburkholderia sp. UYCP14C]|uniref:peptidoglycan recognition protein family protein n=1 Tax=Paraburkholderia sp. UYCP14C TaxID=2511130 RepID=UPI001021E247|nr:peptidoglycan recognition family protein [Paraburkholderia sp. UYCP14C]RZF27371.1 N-acetylmuramoyl-L-alanine amidase [Paraburkholderia sp. UYCP14C]